MAPYVANADSRWNTPEFAALATDAVRKLAVLQSTKAFWEKHSDTFKRDMRVLAKTTDKDFEDFQMNMQKAAMENTSITDETRPRGPTGGNGTATGGNAGATGSGLRGRTHSALEAL